MADHSLFPEVSNWVAQVLLPQAIPSFSYKIPIDLVAKIQVGVRVVVPLGKRKMQTGIVLAFEQKEDVVATKYISDVLDDAPSVANIQLQFMRWLAAYYCCTEGEVLNAVLPSGLKLNSESFISVFDEFELWENLKPEEHEVLSYINECESVKLYKLEVEFAGYKISQILKSLIQHRAILYTEKLAERYKPVFEKRYQLNSKYLRDSTSLEALDDVLKSTPKQLAAIEQLLAHLEQLFGDNISSYNYSFSRKEILALSSISILKSLVNKSIIEEYTVAVSQFLPDASAITYTTPQLSAVQNKAFDEILQGFEAEKPVLLHGVTGSGKTEIYLKLIQQALQAGTQVLFLLPEIALTTQIVQRVTQVFGNSVILYHSKVSERERVETYQKVLSGEARLIVGVRSALMLPFQEIGLIIVDEEHDSSYKQSDPAPRYHGRDSSLVLARFHHAKVLLGSATPSVESHYQATTAKWYLVSLTERFSDALLPEIQLIDLKFAKDAKRIEGNFTHEMLGAITSTVQAGNQVILFQNRRGFARYVSCNVCDYIPKCIRCDVSLTQHFNVNKLRCHYCGYEESMPTHCASCGNEEMQSIGFGTERLEEELHELRPEFNISRMDLDTTRSKGKLTTILKNVESGHTDVLVGTQMVSKGFNFRGVKLVGVFDVDKMMHLPDYRAAERTFQLITQVAGRAGRTGEAGKVMIQTVSVHQQLLQWVVNNDYSGFYSKEIEERLKFNYPPFTRLILLIFRSEAKDLNFQAANAFALDIREKLGNTRVLGPEPPPIGRINNLYQLHVLIKLEVATINLKAVKLDLMKCKKAILDNKSFKGVSIIINVDP